MVTETYGDVLYYTGSDSMIDFPSPESLKKRIVVSTKPPKEYLDTAKSMSENEGSVKTKTISEDDAWGVDFSDPIEKQKSIDEVGTWKIYIFESYVNNTYMQAFEWKIVL